VLRNRSVSLHIFHCPRPIVQKNMFPYTHVHNLSPRTAESPLFLSLVGSTRNKTVGRFLSLQRLLKYIERVSLPFIYAESSEDEITLRGGGGGKRERPGHRGATPQWTLTRVSLRGLALCARTSPTRLIVCFSAPPSAQNSSLTQSDVGSFPNRRCMPADIAQIVVFFFTKNGL
jgi:hypothetical protein